VVVFWPGLAFFFPTLGSEKPFIVDVTGKSTNNGFFLIYVKGLF